MTHTMYVHEASPNVRAITHKIFLTILSQLKKPRSKVRSVGVEAISFYKLQNLEVEIWE